MNRAFSMLASRHPVAMYFVLTFLVSWGGVLVFGNESLQTGIPANPSRQIAMGLSMLAGPFLAGLAMAYFVDGLEGLRRLASGMRLWRMGWWYSALFVFPLSIAGVSVALAAAVSPAFSMVLFLPGLLIGLLAGFMEEVGWTGFAFSHMAGRRSALAAAALLGLAHGAWHALPDFFAHSAFGALWVPYFAAFVLFVVALRILIAWVYVNTQSLLLAQLMHASSTGFLAILVTVDLEPAQWALFYGVYAAVLVLVSAVVVAGFGKPLGMGGRDPV